MRSSDIKTEQRERFPTDAGTEEDNVLLDLHAHTRGISKCCRIEAEAVICSVLGISASEVNVEGFELEKYSAENIGN